MTWAHKIKKDVHFLSPPIYKTQSQQINESELVGWRCENDADATINYES